MQGCGGLALQIGQRTAHSAAAFAATSATFQDDRSYKTAWRARRRGMYGCLGLQFMVATHGLVGSLSFGIDFMP